MTATSRLAVRVGGLDLVHPVLCGSGEHVMTEAGIRAALAAGAAAVIAKSTNESEAARRQLDRTDYVLLDEHFDPLPWTHDPPRAAQLFCRSGLAPYRAEVWIEEVVSLDQEVAASGQYVIPSLILADLDEAARLARFARGAGARALEFNIGAPHGDEAAAGAIVLERAADRVRAITRRIRGAFDGPLWIKLTGQSEDVVALARAARQGGADAVVLVGRLMAMVPDLDTQAPVLETNAAIGGSWALPIACRWLARCRAELGPDVSLVGTNGVRDGRDAARMLLAGAHAVEMASAIWTGGYAALARTVDQLASYLAGRGETAVEITGRAADRIKGYGEMAERPDHWLTFAPRTD